MKRKIAFGLFSLCTLALFATESQAWCLFRCHKYTTQITCRPYNAFTPICWGNLTCDGCCPNPCGVAGGCLPMNMGAPPWASGAGPCFGGACGHNAMVPAPAPANNQFTPPMPMPLPMGPNTTMYPYQGVSQANFYPQPYYPQAYYPQSYYPYAPMYYYPNTAYQPMPYYWHGQ